MTADNPTAGHDTGHQQADNESWIDRHGDVWRLGRDGLMHTKDTAPFSREHVERKWGPLRLVRQAPAPTRSKWAGPPHLLTEMYEDAELRSDDDQMDPSTLYVGWDISFGCRLNFGPSFDRFEVSVHVSDAAKRDGVARLATTPDELRLFAAHLVAVADRADATTLGRSAS
jgi:hypothetical protein